MSSSTIKVAFCDRYTPIRDGLSSIINDRQNCHVIIRTSSSLQLLESLGNSIVLPNVAIIEIDDEYQTTIGVMRLLREQYPSIRLLMLTIQEAPYVVIKMIQAGAHGYLSKNSSVEQLKEAIKGVLTNDYWYSNIASERVFAKAKTLTLPDLTQEEYRYLSLITITNNPRLVQSMMRANDEETAELINSISAKLWPLAGE